MKSSLEIAQEAELQPIDRIAERIGLQPDEIEPYGRYKAKVSLSVIDRLAAVASAKLVCVAGITPTKAGEGKTTSAVGPDAGAGRDRQVAGRCACASPRSGRCSGSRAARAGGGLTQVVPMEDLNLHFTGDIHAIGAANNLLAALLDASILHGNPHKIDALRIGWRRAIDMNDRALRQIVLGLGGRPNGYPARNRLRHHRRLGGDGDPRGGAGPAGSSPPARRDHRRRTPTTVPTGHRRGPWRRRRHDGPAQGRAEAEPDPDARGAAVPDARRTVREHRPRQLVAGGRSRSG